MCDRKTNDYVAKLMELTREGTLSEEKTSRWRDLANVQAERDTGFAYDGYVRSTRDDC